MTDALVSRTVLPGGFPEAIRPFVEAGILRKNPNIKWTKDRGKEPERAHLKKSLVRLATDAAEPWPRASKDSRISVEGVPG